MALCDQVAELIDQNYFKLTNTRKSQDWMKTNIPDRWEKPCKVFVVTQDRPTFTVQLQGQVVFYQGRKRR